MNKLCEECSYSSTTGCVVTSIPNCKLIENKTRLKELDQSKDYLNSDYYWNRRKELLGEEENETS